jgi:hypothetical protein
MPQNLAICIMGNRNSGKSYTWNKLFHQEVRTGRELKKLYLSDGSYIEIFLVSGSPQERKLYVEDIIGGVKARIVLCSIQYKEESVETIKYFIDNGHLLFTQWLNPGYKDLCQVPDALGLVPRLLSYGSFVSIRSGKVRTNQRVQEIFDFLYGWAQSRSLVKWD